MKMFTNKKGFTIVELVIVIAVIAILAAVLIPTFSNVIDKANLSSATQKARTALTAISGELADNNITVKDAAPVFKVAKKDGATDDDDFYYFSYDNTKGLVEADKTAIDDDNKGNSYTNSSADLSDIPEGVTVYLDKAIPTT